MGSSSEAGRNRVGHVPCGVLDTAVVDGAWLGCEVLRSLEEGRLVRKQY